MTRAATTATTAPSETTSALRRYSPWATRFAWCAVGYNVLVILWGALVRATGSGAGCGNHWPLCNGQVVPLAPRIDTIIEFTHRMMVGGSVLVMLVLLVVAFCATVRGYAARSFAVLSAVLLVNEAFLGALLVKLGYVTGNQSMGRVVVLSIHLSNTLLLLGSLALTARALGNGQRWVDSRIHVRDAWIAVVGLAASLLVGVSGSLAALGDTLFPASSLRAALLQDFATNSPWLLRLRGVHPASAMVAAAFVVWLMALARRRGAGRRASVLLGLLGLQFVLGVADVLLLAPDWMQLVHLLGADAYWIALVLLAADVVWRRPTAASSSKPVMLRTA